MAMKLPALFSPLLLLLALSDSTVQVLSIGMGINFGQVANNLPSPAQVAYLLKSLTVSRVKLYDADPNVLSAFANSNIDFVLGLGNEHLLNMTDSTNAQNWIEEYVRPFLPQTPISCIVVGNEVLTGNDTQLMSYLLPAMQTVQSALVNLGLNNQVYVTSAHSLGILGNSFPPSSGTFQQNLAQYIQPILNFHAQVKSPFLINAYPFFAYADNPDQVPLSYVLFQPNPGTVDPNTNLNYTNMLFAQVDSVYSAMKAMGHTDIVIKISETGWPSQGDPNEVGATPENAALYNGNLLRIIEENQGTPANPSVPIDVYVFALFNEDLKPGPTSERNYGLYYPNGTPVYNIGLQGYLPPIGSASTRNAIFSSSLLILVIASLICG